MDFPFNKKQQKTDTTYDKLRALHPHGDARKHVEAITSDDGMLQYIQEEGERTFREDTPAAIVGAYKAALHYGLLMGINYAAAFGVPDCAKDVFRATPDGGESDK